MVGRKKEAERRRGCGGEKKKRSSEGVSSSLLLCRPSYCQTLKSVSSTFFPPFFPFPLFFLHFFHFLWVISWYIFWQPSRKLETPPPTHLTTRSLTHSPARVTGRNPHQRVGCQTFGGVFECQTFSIWSIAWPMVLERPSTPVNAHSNISKSSSCCLRAVYRPPTDSMRIQFGAAGQFGKYWCRATGVLRMWCCRW